MSTAYHPQMDGETEITNRALGNMLRCLVDENIRMWEARLCQARVSALFRWFTPYFRVDH